MNRYNSLTALITAVLIVTAFHVRIPAWTPPVQTKPTFVIDDFEHWSSESELRGWYQKRNPCEIYLDTQIKHTGKNSMRMDLPDATWAGTTHYGDFNWDITGYDSLVYWLKGDGSGCAIEILFREIPIDCAEVFVVDVAMRSIYKDKWVRVALPRNAFMTGYPTNPCNSNGKIDNNLGEFNIMLSAPCNYGKNHTVWIDDIYWIPKGYKDPLVTRIESNAGITIRRISFGQKYLKVLNLPEGRDGMAASPDAALRISDIFDCRGVRYAGAVPTSGCADGIFFVKAR